MAIAAKGGSYVRVAIEEHRGALVPGTDIALLAYIRPGDGGAGDASRHRSDACFRGTW